MISCFNLIIHRPNQGGLLFDGLSLEVSAGEFVELVGPAGSGKSVLCSLLSLRRRKKGAKCIIAGRNLERLGAAGLAKLRRQIGSTTQQPRFLEERSVLENLLLPSVARDQQRGALDAATELLADTTFEAKRAQPAAGLSASERRLLGIFRALIGAPKLVILDGGLEELGELKEQAADAIQHAHAQGSTVLIAAREPSPMNHLRTQLLRLDAAKLTSLEGAHPPTEPAHLDEVP